MFFPDRPVRLAHDRFEQFQCGIKRHAFKMQTRIGVDRATGKIVGFAADHALDGGGLANFSANVATVGATAAIGIYDAPKVDVTTVSFHSRGVTAGSMRCYGTRADDDGARGDGRRDLCGARRSIRSSSGGATRFKPAGRTMAGNPYIVSVRTPEILDKLEQHPIWRQRARRRRVRRRDRSSAPASPAPPRITAPGADCSLGTVEIDPDGTDHHPLRRASRWATASGRRWPIAWRPISAASPTRSRCTHIDAFGPLGLVTSGNPYHDEPGDAGRRGAKSALGSGDQHGHRRFERRACRHARGGRSGARHLPLRPVAGGA